MENRDLAENLARQGYERGMTKYTNQALAKELLDFYHSL
jgi:hypothetical protein